MGILDFLKPVRLSALTADELTVRRAAGDATLVLDVRSAGEFAQGHIAGAVNIPHGELGARTGEMGADLARPIVLCCHSGARAGMAAGVLQRAGYSNVTLLQGHMSGWCAAGRPVEKSKGG